MFQKSNRKEWEKKQYISGRVFMRIKTQIFVEEAWHILGKTDKSTLKTY